VDLRDPVFLHSRIAMPRGAGWRVARHAIAMLLAAALAWLVFSAYRQPDFILDFAGMRLC
jgi:hypothetical protein